MGIFVKICGITNPEDAAAVAALRPDAMGFVFWPQSKRAVVAEEIADWVRDLPEDLLKVGVFVDEPLASIRRTVKIVGLDVVQCHGSESAAFCGDVEGRVWKALHLDRTDFSSVEAYPVDAFLVDSYSSASPGGTGETSDWDSARQFMACTEKSVLLAGGLTPDNVAEAIRLVRPWGVDVSSGVEREPGRKELEKVRRFIDACRS